MPECAKCKEDVAADSQFCSHCGAAVGPAEVTVTAPPRAVEREVERLESVDSSSVHGRFEPGTRIGKRYRIVGLLGRGGMGEVYRADDLELGQSVALKFLPERVAHDPVALNRFRSEVRTARQVTHANVCRIYDIAEQDGHVFLSMEYIDGEDLASVLRRMGRPSPEKAIELARQICLGLAAAHESNILHRDLKPANIMIDGRGRARITDFGLAGLTEELGAKREQVGTPAYMAPEQLAGGKVSVRSDVFSLGLLLYELFTGKRVFDTSDLEELKRTHTSGTPPTPSSISEEIDPVVERVIMRCLESQPNERPPSVYQVLAALPGGDPLAVALAAGELPAPELVANAREAGGLHPKLASGLLVLMLASLVTTYLSYADKTVTPKRPPAALSFIAEQILRDLGYENLPPNSVSGYGVSPNLSASSLLSPSVPIDPAFEDRPPPFRFWRRWTEGEFLPAHYHTPQVFSADGLAIETLAHTSARASTRTHADEQTPGNATVTIELDSSGQLLGLRVMPAFAPESTTAGRPVDWSPIFQRANLQESEARALAPIKRPPVDCDEVTAYHLDRWRGSGPVTIQLGAVGGQVTYFEILGLAADGPDLSQSLSQQLLASLSGDPFVRQTVVIIMLILALRNLRMGRGDRHNAMRCALMVGGLYTLLELVSFPFGKTISPVRLMVFLHQRAVGHIILHTVETWVIYMAVEPYVRKVWPRMLVGTMRLFSGRVTDPAVGREVLIGVVAGCGLTAILAVMSEAASSAAVEATRYVPFWGDLWSMLSPLHFMSMKIHRVAWTVLDGAFVVGLLVAIRLLMARPRVVLICAFLALSAVVFFGGFIRNTDLPTWLALAYSGFGAVVLVLLYTKVGIVSGIVAVFANVPMGLFTLGFHAWYSPYALADLAILLALAVYGFWVSLAGRPIFKDLLAEPGPEGHVTT